MLIRKFLEETACRTPERIALELGAEAMTYRQLLDSVERLSSGLLEQRLVPGDRVALLIPNSFELVALTLAIFRAEMILVPLSLESSPSQNAHILAQTGVKGLITSSVGFSSLPTESLGGIACLATTSAKTPKCLLYADLMSASPKPAPTGEYDPIGLIVYTSGSTGQPKGIAHTQAGIAGRVDDFVKRMRLSRKDKALVVFPVARPLCLVSQLLAMLRVGGTTALAQRPGSSEFWEIYGKVLPTYSLSLPGYARKIIDEPAALKACHLRLRFFISGGDQPSLDLLSKFKSVTGRPLLNMYGLSETGIVAVHPLRCPEKPGSAGKPLPGVKTRIVDEAGRELAPGQTGHLHVRVGKTMPGYWNDTLLTHRAVGSGWLDTQDIFKVDEDGFYWFMGRANDLIVHNGMNVASAAVVEALLGHPSVEEAQLVGLPDEIVGQFPVAFYLQKSTGPTVSGIELKNWLTDRVDAYSLPAACLKIDAWPLTPQGKIDKNQLLALGKQEFRAENPNRKS